jgi:uncharacterized protein YbcI
MRSRGEIEAAVAKALARFERDFLGRGPRDIQAHLVDDTLVVHLRGVLSSAEERLLEVSADGHAPADGGEAAELLRRLRSRLVLAGRSILERLVKEATGARPVGLHHDLSAATGEELMVFMLDAPPACRPPERR